MESPPKQEPTVDTSAGTRNRGRGGLRGRGNRGGRGRGRPGQPLPASTSRHVKQVTQRPTHFIALPIGHHKPLQKRIIELQNRLLSSEPPITGVQKSILIDPRRTHLTLGVMHLVSDDDTRRLPEEESANDPPSKTLSSAVNLLTSLRPRVMEMLGENSLCIPLNRMDIMDPRKRDDLEEAQVLWLGPDLHGGEEYERLKTVTSFIHKAFKDAGFVVDKRPLKLHVTVVNTVYRRGPRQPFSYSGVLRALGLTEQAFPVEEAANSSTSAFSEIEPTPPSVGSPHSHQHRTIIPNATTPVPSHASSSCSPSRSPPIMSEGRLPDRPRSKPKRLSVPMDLGLWRIDEVQICVMGSHGPENEYVSAGSISLRR